MSDTSTWHGGPVDPLPRHLWPTTEWAIRDPAVPVPDYNRLLDTINADGHTVIQLPKP